MDIVTSMIVRKVNRFGRSTIKSAATVCRRFEHIGILPELHYECTARLMYEYNLLM